MKNSNLENEYSFDYSSEYPLHITMHKKSGQKKNLNKIATFITEIAIHPKMRTGHPEPLKGYECRNVYSRRIDKKHRLIYEIFEEEKRIELLSAWGHYNDK